LRDATSRGNALTVDEEKRKLELVGTAKKAWLRQFSGVKQPSWRKLRDKRLQYGVFITS
jgi:hypothetical protein